MSTATAAPPLLAAADLRKVYRGRRLGRRYEVVAVDQVSFSVVAGETVALVGESGCGKSTVGQLLLRLVEADDGHLRFAGQEIDLRGTKVDPTYRRAVQIVFQNPLAAFNPMRTIGASILDAMRLRTDLHRQARNELARELLELVGLDPSLLGRHPGDVSGGQLQRAGIARALATDPEVLFLDEPTSALDASIRGQIVELLTSLQARTGMAYVLVSHDMRLVRATATQVVVMYLGQVVEEGPASAVLGRPMHPYTRALLRSAGMLDAPPDSAETPNSVGVAGPGCRFAPRCLHRTGGCDQPQQLRPVAASHSVRCWRARELEEGRS